MYGNILLTVYKDKFLTSNYSNNKQQYLINN